MVVGVKEAELKLLMTSIENVKRDDKVLFFVFLQAKTKYGSVPKFETFYLCVIRLGKQTSHYTLFHVGWISERWIRVIFPHA